MMLPRQAVEHTKHETRTVYYALATIVAVGFGLRLWGLTRYGVWFDEAYHVQLVRLPTTGVMLDTILSNPPSDPLYALLLRGWTALFGYGDAAIRSLSVLISTATIPATYRLGRVFFGYRAGLLGACLLALSPYAVEFGQEATLYALASLTATMALAAGWQWRGTGSRRDGAIFVASGTVAIYSHYVVAVILGLFAFFSLVREAGPRRVRAKTWLLAHAIILLAWLPWLVPLALHWLNADSPRVALSHSATWSEIVGALTQFTSGTAALQRGVRALEWAGLLLGAIILALGWQSGKPVARRGLRLLMVISLSVFTIPALVSAVTGLWLFVPHFMLFLLPALFVALASGMVAFWPTSAKAHTEKGESRRVPQNRLLALHTSRYIAPLLLSAWLVVQMAGLALYYRYPPHGADGLRELAAVINSEKKSTDLLLVTPPILTPTLRQYYDGPLQGLPYNFDLRNVYEPYAHGVGAVDLRPSFDLVSGNHARIWLVYNAEGWDEEGTLLKSVREKFKELEHRNYGFADLYLFEKEPIN